MHIDPSHPLSGRAPARRAARTVLGCAALAVALVACGTAGAELQASPIIRSEPSDARAPAPAAPEEPDAGEGTTAEEPDAAEGTTAQEPGAAEDAAAPPAAGEKPPGTTERAERPARPMPARDVPAQARASELPGARTVGADAAEIAPIAALLGVHEKFVPSKRPADKADEKPAPLDPAAVTAAGKAARGGAYQEVLASLTQFDHEGWAQRGTAVVVGKPVVAPIGVEDGESVRVTVCLDASRVTLVDRDGTVVRAAEQGRKALHNYDLHRRPGQAWQVVQHGFPADPSC